MHLLQNQNDFRSNKILDEVSLNKIIKNLKRDGKTIGFCVGSYDFLHPGHMKHFESAKSLCDVLIVGVTSDKFVKKRKGQNRPILSEELRLYSIAQLESVDYVILSEYERATDLIRSLKPTYYIKGSDYVNKNTPGITAEREAIYSVGGEIRYTSDVKFSTTDLIEKIKRNNSKPICLISAGMAGIGKTSLLRAYSKKHGFVFINKDSMLSNLHLNSEAGLGLNYGVKNNIQIYLMMLEFAKDNLENGLSIVIDGYFSNKLDLPEIKEKFEDINELYNLIKIYFTCSKSTLEERIIHRNSGRDINKIKNLDQYYEEHKKDETSPYDIIFNTDGDVLVNVDSLHHEIMKNVNG